MNFYIPIEIKNRDYLSRLLVAYHALYRGYNVYLGSKTKIDTFIKSSRPGIYFGLVTTQTYSKFYKKLKKKNFKIFISDEEGLITFNDKMYLDLKVSEESLEHIETLFTWGEEHKKIITSKFPKFSSKIFSSGTPRFDLLDKSLRDIFNENVKIIQRKFGKFILICGSFSFVNHFTKNLNYLEVLKKQNVINNIEDERRFLKYCDYNKQSLKSFIYLTQELSKKYSNYNIIFRPHPAENKNYYKEKFKGLKNVFVEDDKALIEWIIASKCIVHSYCTSSIEALLVDKTRFGLKDNFDPEIHKIIPYEFSIVANDVNLLVSRISDFIDNKKKIDKVNYQNHPNFKKYISNRNNILSSEVILNRINELYPPNFKHQFFLTDNIIFKFLNIFRNFKRIIYSLNKDNNKHNAYLQHKIRDINYMEIKKDLELLNKKKIEIKIEKIAKDLFFLNKM